MEKVFLDACCGSRMMWFDKKNPMTLFMDIRDEEHTLCDGRNLLIKPDVVGDFKRMPFANESFKLVVMDPPHLVKIGPKSWMFKKYGRLESTWQRDLKDGVEEAFRVLKPDGFLVFKWNEHQVTLNEVLKAIDRKPLFGHTSGKHGKTIWILFHKQF